AGLGFGKARIADLGEIAPVAGLSLLCGPVGIFRHAGAKASRRGYRASTRRGLRLRRELLEGVHSRLLVGRFDLVFFACWRRDLKLGHYCTLRIVTPLGKADGAPPPVRASGLGTCACKARPSAGEISRLATRWAIAACWMVYSLIAFMV